MMPISFARTWLGPAALRPSVRLPGSAGNPATANISAHYHEVSEEAGAETGRTIAGHSMLAFNRNNNSNKWLYISTVKLCPSGSVVDGLLPLWNALLAQLVRPGCSSFRKTPRYLTTGEACEQGVRESAVWDCAGTSAHLQGQT